jgi:hypothetical protein
MAPGCSPIPRRTRPWAALAAILRATVLLLTGCAGTPAFDQLPKHVDFALPPTPVMVFFVDGMEKRILTAMAANGELPLLKRYLLDRSVEVENAITGVPGVTFANATTMVTGQHAGHHGIFANRWFDQHLLASRNYESAATMADVNHDFTVPTIYEILDGKVTCVIGMQVNRGAHIALVTDATNGGLAAYHRWQDDEYEEVDSLMADALREVVAQSRIIGHWPDFTLVYFPGVDLVGHDRGPQSDAYRSALRNLDRVLGGALRVLDAAGLLTRMTIVLTSDHGFQPIGLDQHLQLDDFLGQELGIPTYLTNTAGERVATVPYPERFVLFQRFRIVATHSGDRYASLHLQSTDGWSRHPALDEILSFHRHGAASLAPAVADLTFPEVLVRQPAIDFAAVRVSDDEVRLWGKHGSSVVGRHRLEDRAVYRYRVVAGDDPLGYASDPRASGLCDGQFHEPSDWLAATATLPHPDIAPRLGEAFESPRAGDIMIFAAPGWDFSLQSLGGHGGLERDEMLIPMYFAGPDLPPGSKVGAARLSDLVPTLLELMGWRDSAVHPSHFDGVSIADRLRRR